MLRATVKPLAKAITVGLSHQGGADPLVFHALDDVDGSYVNDVIVGTGSITEARTSTIYAADESGVYQAFTSGQPAKTYQGGKWWLVAQPALTNSITYSRDLTNAAWAETGTSVAAYNAVGLTGEANTASTLTDDDGAGHESAFEDTTIADDSNTHTARVFVKKDADTSRFPEFELNLTGGTPQSINLQVNTSTGATSVRSSLGTVDSAVRDASDWWEILLSVANNGSGNTNGRVRIYPALSTSIGGNDVSATGSITVSNVELHLNTTIAAVRGSGPIFTSGSSVTTNATSLSFDDANHDDTQGAWYAEYLRYSTVTNGLLTLGGTNGRIMYNGPSTNLQTRDGTNTISISGTTVDVAAKAAVAHGGGNLALTFNGSTTTGSYDGAWSNADFVINVNTDRDGNEPDGVQLMRNVRRYDLPYDQAQAKIDELMT